MWSPCLKVRNSRHQGHLTRPSSGSPGHEWAEEDRNRLIDCHLFEASSNFGTMTGKSGTTIRLHLAWQGMWLKAVLIAVIVGAQCACEGSGGVSTPTCMPDNAAIRASNLPSFMVLERLRGGAGVNERDRKRAEKYKKLKQVSAKSRQCFVSMPCR